MLAAGPEGALSSAERRGIGSFWWKLRRVARVERGWLGARCWGTGDERLQITELDTSKKRSSYCAKRRWRRAVSYVHPGRPAAHSLGVTSTVSGDPKNRYSRPQTATSWLGV